MSWQAYVDDNLVGTGKVVEAAIHGLDGTPWASSNGLKVLKVHRTHYQAPPPLLTISPPSQVTKDEVEKLVLGCEDPQTALSSGLHLSGEKYITIKADNRSLCAKKGERGFYAVKTNKAVVIGTFFNPTPVGDAAVAVESFADYLISEGYVEYMFFFELLCFFKIPLLHTHILTLSVGIMGP